MALVSLMAMMPAGAIIKPLPPRHHGLPILGDTLSLLSPKTMASYQVDRANTLGPVWCTRLLFKDAVVVTGADALSDLAKEEGQKPMTAFFPPQQKVLFGSASLLVNSGPRHSQLRRLVGQSLTPAAVKACAATIDAAVEECVARCLQQAGDERVVALADEMRRFALRAGIQVLLGGDGDSEEVANLAADLKLWGEGLVAPPLFFLPWSSAARAMRARRRIKARLEPLITAERARMHAGSGSSSSLLGRLTAAKDDDGNALNTDEIIDNVLTLLFAGSDTTASGLTSSLKELALAPALQAQLRQALRDADEADEALDAFLAEVHRRNPPAPFQMRLVGKEDLAVGGYKVSANSLVVYGYAGTLLADAKAYPDPDAFDPSRWKPQGAAPNWAFGGGPRMCPGRMLALAESRALLKRVLGTNGFTWHLVDGQDLQGRYSPGLFPADRLLARIAHTGAANE
jgi:cytochrome P450